MVTGSADSTLKLWDRRKLTTADGAPNELHVFLSHNQAINTVEWSPVRKSPRSPLPLGVRARVRVRVAPGLGLGLRLGLGSLLLLARCLEAHRRRGGGRAAARAGGRVFHVVIAHSTSRAR